jgi:branched-chain amino acid transport system permease protein
MSDPRRAERIGIAVAIAVALALPVVVADHRFQAFIVGITCLYVLWASGMNLLAGFTGLMPLMYAGLAGIGAYVTVNLVMKFGVSFWLAMPVGAVAAALVGVVLGLPSLRLRGFYFTLSSIVIQSALTLLFVYFPQFTGGDTGISQIPAPTVPLVGEVPLAGVWFEEALVVAAIATVLAVRWITRSRLGSYLVAIREDDLLSETLGIDVTRYRVLAFFLSSLAAGMGGAFYAHYVGFVSPRSFDVLTSLNIWLMAAFGGRGTLVGPVLGAVILAPIPYLLQDLYLYKDVIYGVLIVLVTIFLPGGVYGSLLPIVRARLAALRPAPAPGKEFA